MPLASFRRCALYTLVGFFLTVTASCGDDGTKPTDAGQADSAADSTLDTVGDPVADAADTIGDPGTDSVADLADLADLADGLDAAGDRDVAGDDAGDAGTASYVVGTDGAFIDAGDGLTLDIPAGAVDAEITITIEEASLPDGSGLVPISTVYRFGPAGTTFNSPITLTLPYDDTVAGEADFYQSAPGEPETFDAIEDAVLSDGVAVADIDHFCLKFVAVPGQTVQLTTYRTVRGAFEEVRDPLWVAVQDGAAGVWALVSPTAPGRYEFAIAGGQYGVAMTCGERNLENELIDPKSVLVVHASAAAGETTLHLRPCRDPNVLGTATLSGSVMPPSEEVTVCSHTALGLANNINGCDFESYNATVAPGTYDLLAQNRDGAGVPTTVYTRRDVEVLADRTLDIDFASEEYAAPATAVFAIDLPENAFASFFYHTATTRYDIAGGLVPVPDSYAAFLAERRDEDVYRFRNVLALDLAGSPYAWREVLVLRSAEPIDLTGVTPPDRVADVTPMAGPPPGVSWTAYPDAIGYDLTVTPTSAPADTWLVRATSEWLGAGPTLSLSLPDFSALSFDASCMECERPAPTEGNFSLDAYVAVPDDEVTPIEPLSTMLGFINSDIAGELTQSLRARVTGMNGALP